VSEWHNNPRVAACDSSIMQIPPFRALHCHSAASVFPLKHCCGPAAEAVPEDESKQGK